MPHKEIADHRRVDALTHRKRSNEARQKVIQLLGRVCTQCGFSDSRAIAIDHINGGGTSQRKAKGGNYYSFVLREIENGSTDYQLLCFNCNEIKKKEAKEQNNLKYAG